MAGGFSKKRKVEDAIRGRNTRPKKFKKQKHYDSDSSSDEDNEQSFKPVSLEDSDDEADNVKVRGAAHDDEPDLDDVSSGSESEGSDSEPEVLEESEEDEEDEAEEEEAEGQAEEEDGDSDHEAGESRKRKRNDPDAFATSMSKILSSKLSTSKRSDPVLARSAAAQQAAKEISEHALENKAKHKLKEEKKALLDKGRVKDVLGASTAFDAAHRGDTNVPSVADTMALEKRLRKTAQRGVVKLFNAFRAAQVKAEEAERLARQNGVIGQKGKEEKVTEMSKQGFLDLIAGGGGGALNASKIQEA